MASNTLSFFHNCFIFTLLVSLTLSSRQIPAQVFQYTNTQTDTNNIALGYPVPIPLDSLTPISGFRTYDSLSLRHFQLSEISSFIQQHQIGTTTENRPIYAYQIGDTDDQKLSGGREGSVLINGGIHAREWQTPEATTAFMEYLYNNQNDQFIADYILHNINFVVIPVLNIDGFLQTQRFPESVTNTKESPRDGRMRRKNMRDVDDDLTTEFNNLGGIDLNRNNNPYWATSTQSSSSVDSIVYHGTSAASEPETQALKMGAVLAGEDRLRLYIDTHSFSLIYLSHYTNNTARNDLNNRLALIMRAANDYKYRYSASRSGSGIGSTDEYFANTYQALSYTLEIEPLSSSSEYGGFGFSHDGFILPNSEVQRMREETTSATMSGLYAIADIPFLQSIEITRINSQVPDIVANWVSDTQTRNLEVVITSPLQTDQDYIARLTFNKPMRHLSGNQVVDFSNLSSANGMRLSIEGIVNNTPVSYPIDEEQGTWLVDEGFTNYKTDTFLVPFTLPSNFDWSSHSKLAIAVTTTDYSGQGLDSDPATIVDWDNGSWTQYEDEIGSKLSQTGGTSEALRLIDDNSPLFDSPPVTTPNPNPNPSNQVSSGGSMNLLILLALALLIFNRPFVLIKGCVGSLGKY